LETSSIIVGKTGSSSGATATFDAVDIYIKSDATSEVKVQSPSNGTDTFILTLTNGAKISGLTGAGTAGTVSVSATTGDVGVGSSIADMVAVTGAVGTADAGNYLGIAAAPATSGTITVAAVGGTAKYYSIKIATLTNASGA
jgi:hypothetical protein